MPEDCMPTSERFIVNGRERARTTLRFSLGLALALLCCAQMARAQMRPMTNITVGTRESESKQKSASTVSTSTTSATPAADTKAPKASTQTTPANETVAPAKSTTRARRVAPTAASTATQPAPVEVKENTSVKASAPPRIEMEDEPPPMVSVKKSETKDEAKASNRLETLRAQIEDTKDDAERARLRRMLVDYLVSLDQKHEALTELREMMREERFDPVGFYNIGNALVRLGDEHTALDAYRKAISQRHGNYARALNNLGVLLLRQERWDEAQEALVNALRQENFHYAEASYNLGRLYAARGEAPLAIMEWRRTLLIQPNHADAALALARALAENGNAQRGLEVLDQFTARNGPNEALDAARQQLLKQGAAK